MSLLRKRNSFEEKLKEQLGETEWKPSDSLWDRIEQNIDADGFEPALQKKLEDYRVEPHEEVWQGVEASLPESGHRRGAIWFTAGLVALLVTFVTGYWYGAFRPADKQRTEIIAESPIQKTITETQPATLESGNQPTRNNSSGPTKRESNAIANPGTDNAEPEIKPTTKISTDGRAGSVRQKGKSRDRTIFVNRGKKKNTGLPAVVMAEPTVPKPPGPTLPEIITSKSSSTQNAGLTVITRDTNSETLKSTAIQTPVSIIPDEPLPPVVKEIPSTNTKETDSLTVGSTYRGSSYLAPDEEFTRFSITVRAGIHNSYMVLDKPSGSDYGDLSKSLALRKEMEKPALDFSGGIQVDYHFGKNWWISAGIGMTSMHQQIQFNTQKTLGGSPTVVDPKGNYQFMGDSIVSGTIHRYENRYSFTEIPLNIGYRFPSESNFHFEISGGISYARLNLINAYMPDPGCVGLLLVTDKESFPEFRDQLFLTLMPAATWSLNSSVDLGAALTGKAGVNSFVGNPSWIAQRPVLAGISIFLRKRL